MVQFPVKKAGLLTKKNSWKCHQISFKNIWFLKMEMVQIIIGEKKWPLPVCVKWEEHVDLLHKGDRYIKTMSSRRRGGFCMVL